MIPSLHFVSWRTRLTRHAWRDDRAAQLVEFAVSLPLLVVFVVGIFDFSGAFTLKQKLTNIARDAARAAAADPSNDLAQSPTLPASVWDALQLVQGNLMANNIDQCGLNSASYVNGPVANWKFTGTASSCPTGGLTVIINRGYYFPAGTLAQPANIQCQSPPPAGAQTEVVATCVSIQYAYQWRFGRVASLLGSTSLLPTTINAIAVSMNEN